MKYAGICLLALFAAGAARAAMPATPSPEALALGRTLAEKSGTGRMSAMSGLSLPMARAMHDLGVGQEHSNVVVHEAIMPTLEDHEDDLTEIQAQSYAETLSVDDMKAAIAFYDSPAGKDLVRAHPQIMMANMGGLNALFQKLMPAFKAKTDEVLKNHGWTTTP